MSRAFADHFSAVAAAYASYRPHYPDALFSYLATLPRRRELAWDCGAGSGQASLGLTPFFRRIVATDASEDQIAAAPAHPQVQYRVAPAEASGLADGTVDLVTVAQALHWFDLPAFYAEVVRVLAPGGVLAVWAYGVQHLEEGRIDHLLQHFYTTVVGPFWPPERRLVESGYRTVPFPFAELTPPSFAMTAEWRLPELVGYLRTWSAATLCREATGRDPVDELAHALAPLWGAKERVRAVRWPLCLRVGRAAAE